MQIFDNRIDAIFHTKLKRYADTDAHHFFALHALPNVAAVTIFSDMTLKDNLSPKLLKSF